MNLYPSFVFIALSDTVSIEGTSIFSVMNLPPVTFTISLRAIKTKDGYKFKTQSNGRDFYKSPEEMFKEEFIDNDLKIVDDAIKEYYGIQ